MIWNHDCQMAFEKIKKYLLNHPLLVPQVPNRPLIICLAVHETLMGYVLGQHDESGKQEQVIYYLSKSLPIMDLNIPLWKRLVVPWFGQHKDCTITWYITRYVDLSDGLFEIFI